MNLKLCKTFVYPFSQVDCTLMPRSSEKIFTSTNFHIVSSFKLKDLMLYRSSVLCTFGLSITFWLGFYLPKR